MATDFTVAEFAAWARTKPADEEYDFFAPDHCAVSQFVMNGGRDWTWGALATRLESLVPAKPSPWLTPQTYIDADCGEHVL